MRELGFGVAAVGEEMHGSGHVAPEMWVPGTNALRMSILASWVDVAAGHIAIDLFERAAVITKEGVG